MTEPERPPVWRDPLLARPPQPTGTGSGAYVEQPEPRANPMTVEGEIAAFGEMARGAARLPGASGLIARVFIGALLMGTLFAAVYGAVSAFR